MSDGVKIRGSLLLKDHYKTVLLREEFVQITGDVVAALVLSQMHYWSDRATAADGWVYKSAREMQEELLGAAGEEKIRKAFLLLVDQGYLERDDTRGNSWNRTAWYRFDADAVQKAIDDLPERT